MNTKVDTKSIPKWVRSAIVYWWLVGFAILATFWAARNLRGLLIQLLVALFLSLAMHPLIEKLHMRGMKRGAATGLTMAAVLIFFGIFLSVMGALIVNQIRDLIDELPSYTQSLSNWTESTFDFTLDTQRLETEIQNRGGDYIDNVADSALSFSSFVIGFLFQILTVSLFAFYLAADGPKLRRAICSLLPEHRQVEVLRVWETAIDKTGAYISSRVILAIASSAFHWIVFAIVGIPSPLALGLWVGIISQFVPVVGTYISGVLPLLIALADDPIKALYVVIIILAYQQIENYVLQPRITAQTLNMHPAIAFGGVLAGSSLLGATGAVLALPIIATFQALATIYVERHSVIDSDLVDRRSPSRVDEEPDTTDQAT